MNPPKGLKTQRDFNGLVTLLYQKDWVVYAKKPFRNSSQIINYLGRYSHRVAIANSRIKDIEGDLVTFTMKDYRDGKQKMITLQPAEFIRRFLLHVLPKSFCKIRYYGLFATRNRTTVLSRCRKAMGMVKARSKFTGLTWQQQYLMVTGKSIDDCPVCKTGRKAQTLTMKPIGMLA
ncbi:MAG: transposase [Bacteroidales bacterium]|nr:transposase [Bacteroidales bacterium]